MSRLIKDNGLSLYVRVIIEVSRVAATRCRPLAGEVVQAEFDHPGLLV